MEFFHSIFVLVHLFFLLGCLSSLSSSLSLHSKAFFVPSAPPFARPQLPCESPHVWGSAAGKRGRRRGSRGGIVIMIDAAFGEQEELALVFQRILLYLSRRPFRDFDLATGST